MACTTWYNGPMRKVNPLVVLRESAGLTQAQLAEQTGVTAQAIMRAEQAVYATPPSNILDALWELAPEDDLHDYTILMADYNNYQAMTRQENYGALDPDFSWESVPDGEHPFVEWRVYSDLSRIGVSTKFCVHPSLVFRFEAQSHMCTSPPKELLRALLESGYDTKYLMRFEEAYRKFREVKSAKIKRLGYDPDEGVIDLNDHS